MLKKQFAGKSSKFRNYPLKSKTGLAYASPQAHSLITLDKAHRMGQGSAMAPIPEDSEGVETFSNLAVALAQGTHKRLGAASPLAILDSGDLLMEILRFVPLVVPDHVETLKEAVKVAVSGQLIHIRKGEHMVGANFGQKMAHCERGDTVLEIRKSLTLRGEPGTLLRGMLYIRKGASCGRIQDLKIQDAGQCCVLAECGTWVVDNCYFMCGHAAAVRGEGDAVIQASRTRFGGEGEIGQAVAAEYELPRQWIDTAGSVQEYGIRKNSCYGAFVKDSAEVSLTACEVSYCSESAIFMRDAGGIPLVGRHIHSWALSASDGVMMLPGSVTLRRCLLTSCHVGFTAGEGCQGSLAVEGGCRMADMGREWYDNDRPPRLQWEGEEEDARGCCRGQGV